jgi:hypothetical protein
VPVAAVLLTSPESQCLWVTNEILIEGIQLGLVLCLYEMLFVILENRTCIFFSVSGCERLKQRQKFHMYISKWPKCVPYYLMEVSVLIFK